MWISLQFSNGTWTRYWEMWHAYEGLRRRFSVNGCLPFWLKVLWIGVIHQHVSVFSSHSLLCSCVWSPQHFMDLVVQIFVGTWLFTSLRSDTYCLGHTAAADLCDFPMWTRSIHLILFLACFSMLNLVLSHGCIDPYTVYPVHYADERSYPDHYPEATHCDFWHSVSLWYHNLDLAFTLLSREWVFH